LVLLVLFIVVVVVVVVVDAAAVVIIVIPGIIITFCCFVFLPLVRISSASFGRLFCDSLESSPGFCCSVNISFAQMLMDKCFDISYLLPPFLI
jgi:hypothetical protein